MWPRPQSPLVFEKSFGLSGSGDGEINDPIAITISPAGGVYVSEYGNNRVQMFNTEGRFRVNFGSFDTGGNGLHKPRGIAAGADNRIYVVDNGNHCVRYFDPEGRIVMGTFGSNGASP